MTSVRLATVEDTPKLIEMGREFLAASPYRDHYGENVPQMQALVARLLDTGGIAVAVKDAVIVGMLGYIVYNHFISGAKTFGEVFWWVAPEHRGTGLKLLKWAEAFAHDVGAATIQMISPDARVTRLYEHLGYDAIETTYQKKLC